MSKHYFLGGNTPLGFYSYFEYIADEHLINKLYVIKGGPGSGKSSLMKYTAQWAEQHGYSTEYIHCSSDPSSLDGIIIKELSIAMADGTAPHVIDPKYPACSGEIINMAEFWDAGKISANREAVIACSDKISECFGSAYDYLASVSGIYKNIKKICNANTDVHLLSNIAESICDKAFVGGNKNKAGKIKKGFLSAVCPNGVESYVREIDEQSVYVLQSHVTTVSSIVLEKIKDECMRKNYDVECYYNPLSPENELEHIIVPEASVAVLTCNLYNPVQTHGKAVIDLDNLLASAVHDSELIKNKSLVEMLVNKAVMSVTQAKNLHDELEKYYVTAMDFNAVNEFREQFVKNLENII